MEDLTIKPVIFVSKCLGFEACRWNGGIIPDSFVDKLKEYVSFFTVCPEVEIGLGVPRDPIRIVLFEEEYFLKQLNTGRDVTREMKDFSEGYVSSIEEVDGFILKDRSPSCGLKGVKVYPGMDKSSPVEKTSGFFAGKVKERFPLIPVETEGRLSNFSLREHFLTRIFTQAKFRKIKKSLAIKDLVSFQADNKFLLMAYSQKEMRELGKITANHRKLTSGEVFNDYQLHLAAAMVKPPRYTSAINVMMHALGYFSGRLSKDEKHLFLNYLEEFRREQVPMSVPLSLLRSYVVRFNEVYLMRQSFFSPYPKKLSLVTDSGKGRKR